VTERSQDDRGISDVIGFIIVFGLVAATVAIISLSGMGSLEDARNNEMHNNAERAFDVLADNMADIFREDAPSRATEVSLEEAQMDVSSTVRVNVSGNDGSSLTTMLNTTVQPIVWRSTVSQDTEVVYSLGAVIRDERQSGLVQNEPPFVMSEDRLYLPVVRTKTDKRESYAGSTVRVRGVGDGASDKTVGVNHESFSSVWLNITTPRADIWEQYFEQKAITDQCIRDSPGGNERVACELEASGEVYVSVHSIEVAIEQ
jgi:hypothetical protein